MSDMNEMIRNNQRLHTRVKKLCAPLFQHFGFNGLFYHHISNEGYATSLGSHIESFEEYLCEQHFKHNPYLRHPDFFQNSLYLIPDIIDPIYQAGLNEISTKYKLKYKVVFLEKTASGCQGFSFAVDPGGCYATSSYIVNHIPLLKRFICRFKEDGGNIIQEALKEQISCGRHLGKIFFEKPSLIIPSKEKENKIQFLKQIGILHPTDDMNLSQRERQCIQYLLQGYTAAETAIFLKLSKRTVESYLQNIKLKVNCDSKQELIEKFKELENLGLL